MWAEENRAGNSFLILARICTAGELHQSKCVPVDFASWGVVDPIREAVTSPDFLQKRQRFRHDAMDLSSSGHVSNLRVERLGQRAAGKITRGLLGQSFTLRKWMAELVLVLALFERVLQQLFDLLFMVHFSKTMVSPDRHS